jgi:hypothetical protein
MARILIFFAAVLLSCKFSFSQLQPSKTSQRSVMDLHGAVHTVSTEILDFAVTDRGVSIGSTFDVYDLDGYVLEHSRYDENGSLLSRTDYERRGWQVFKLETRGTDRRNRRTVVQLFNSDGLVAEIDTYNGRGALTNQTVNDYAQPTTGTTASSSEQRDVSNGSVSTTKTIDGPFGRVTSKDGTPYSNFLIQRDAKGNPMAETTRFADGSFSDLTVKPDGTTVQHSYSASTKTEAHRTMDAQEHLIEVVEESHR